MREKKKAIKVPSKVLKDAGLTTREEKVFRMLKGITVPDDEPLEFYDDPLHQSDCEGGKSKK